MAISNPFQSFSTNYQYFLHRKKFPSYKPEVKQNPSLTVAVESSFREARVETPVWSAIRCLGEYQLPTTSSLSEQPAEVSPFSSFPCHTVLILLPKVLKKLYKRQDRYFLRVYHILKKLSSEGKSLPKTISSLAAADSCLTGAFYQRPEIYKLQVPSTKL